MTDPKDEEENVTESPRSSMHKELKEDGLGSDILPLASSGSSPKGIMKISNNKKDFSLSSTSIESSRSPKKVRIAEPPQNERAANVQSISEIEGIRRQLKSVIGLGQNQNDSNCDYPYHPGFTVSADTSHFANENNKGSELSENFDPAAMFSGLLSYRSPQLQMDDNGLLRMDAISDLGINSRDYTSPQTDKSLLIEMSMMKDNLEREQQRRKHCEHQIQDLQKKILEMQQQLAIAVATDKKKAIMIEQLDKTLARVVGGWKKHESDRIAMIERLKNENSVLHKSQNRQQEILAQFEKELSHAVESITKEQGRAKVAEEEKQAQLTRHQNEREEAFSQLEKEREVVRSLNDAMEKLQEQNDSANKQIEDMEEDAAKNRESWLHERSELQNELEAAKSQLHSEIESLRESASSYQKDAQEALSQLTTLQHENQNMEIELDAAMGEKESLRMEISLLEAKLEAVKTKQESEQTGKLQEEFNRRINLIQEEIMKTEAELKNAHKEQILDLNIKHKEDLEKQLHRFHEELNRNEDMVQNMKVGFEKRLFDAQNEIVTLNESRRDLESQRKELMRRLQTLMQQHMQEAVSLIGLESDGHSLHSSQSPMVTKGERKQADASIKVEHSQLYNSSLSSMGKEQNPNNTHSSFNLLQKAGNLKDSFFGSETIRFTRNEETVDRRGIEDSRELLRDSIYGPWSKLEEIESPEKHLFDHSTFDVSTSTVSASQGQPPVSLTDNLSYRQDRFQTGLQDLSDKLRISAKIGNHEAFSHQDKTLGSFGRNEKEARVTQPSQDTWAQVQALLRSKMDEVESDNHSMEEAESTLKEQTIETAYGSPRVTRKNILHFPGVDEQIQEQENRQVQLTHFIKQLLNKSPGNPMGDNTDDEDEKSLDIHGNAPAGTAQSNERLQGLPLGSDFVSKDSYQDELKTPQKAPSTSHISRAFKKSVLKEKPFRSGIETKNMKNERAPAGTVSVSPRKSPSKKPTNEELKKREQLTYLMKALGINADASMQDLDGMINLVQNAQKGLLQEKSKTTKTSHIKQNTNRTSKPLIGSHANKPQSQKQQAPKNQKGRPDDVFTRLQRIYGNTEEPQGVQRGFDSQGKNTGSKNVSRSLGNQPSKVQNFKGKDQRRITNSPRNSSDKLVQAWK